MTRESPPSRPPAPQSIPLQDFSKTQDQQSYEPEDEHFSPGHGRSGSLFARARQSIQYARLEGDEPSITHKQQTRLETITGANDTDLDNDIYSPIAPVAFADAHVGLTFDPESRPDLAPYNPFATPRRPTIVTTPADGDPSQPSAILSPDDDDDLTPLTNKRSVKSPNKLSPGVSDRMSRKSSLRWGNNLSPSPQRGRSSRLGDDLPSLQTGLGVQRKPSSASGIARLQTPEPGSGRSQSRSPSPSPLARANSIFREISQRVVNISNDTEMVEQSMIRKSASIRRRQSISRVPDDPENVPEPSTSQELNQTSASEKCPTVKVDPDPFYPPVRHLNPLRGKALGLFGPENPLRKWLLELLTHPATEPIILILIIAQTILLAVNAATDAQYDDDRSRQWGGSVFDYAIFALFVLYTIEVIARTIVSGFLFNPVEYSVLDRSQGFRRGLHTKLENMFSLQHTDRPVSSRRGSLDVQPPILRAFTGLPEVVGGPGHGRQKQRIRLARRAFLRHSFNRLDFVAVVSYWISFVLQISRYEASHHMYLFNMLSCLRILRLLGLTAGMSMILRSLKKAAPLLVNVAFLISFFWLIFAIIGVQSFKSSLRRTCVWVGDDGSGNNYTQNVAPENVQFCGGYLDLVTGAPMPWLRADGTNGTSKHKGFLCPQNSLCVEAPPNNSSQMIYNGTVSFDNIIQSLELVFVIISSNTFSDLMYYLTASDYLLAALFFAFGIVVLTLWLVNLLVAVITSSFQIIREESKQSAFNVAQQKPKPQSDERRPPKAGRLKQLVAKSQPFFILLIVADLIIAALRSDTMSPFREALIMNTETVVTLLLLMEIILRFASDWRKFFLSKRNCFDLLCAVITSVVQLPPIRGSGQAYAWLSFFQIVRIYRVVLAIRVTRDLVMIVFRNADGLFNLIIFVFLFTFLSAILAVQLFRGDLPFYDNSGTTIFIQFFDIWNSFMGMYIIFSSENWTQMLYNITEYNLQWNTAWMGALFFIGWFIVANLIVLNMFIAVIQESFDVSEDEKRLQQVRALLTQKEIQNSSSGGLPFTSMFRLGRDSLRQRDPLEFGGAALEQLLKDAVVNDFLDEHQEHTAHQPVSSTQPGQTPPPTRTPNVFARAWSKVIGLNKGDPNPFYSDTTVTRANEEFDPKAMAQRIVSSQENRRRAQRQYLARHPKYNVSLFIFKPSNPIRRLCQTMVGPGRGSDRIEGVQPWKPAWYIFSTVVYLAIVAMVLIACVTTPLYQRQTFQNAQEGTNWIVWTDLGFAALFSIEAIVKTIADGFVFTPHAYFRNIWGMIDVVVLITLWVNVFTTLNQDDSVARGIGAFKALRALRLLNISENARNTFHSVIIIGGYKVLSAAFVSLSLLVPFAILGVNLFAGKMKICNDQNFAYGGPLSDCVGEFNSTPFANNWPVLAPHVVANPQWSFDNFGSALFILFQIVSQEGWVNVMQSAVAITGVGLQPRQFASQGNAVYFIVFNLLGAVFVLTLFISVFMRNYTEQTGVAFLTSEQRSWLEFRKLLKQISPTKRSIHDGTHKWRKWCYELAAKKRGKWQRFITCLLLFHLVLLIIEYYPEPAWWEAVRNIIYLVLTLLYLANIVIRVIGLTWTRFRRSSWDLYSVPAVTGSFVTSIMALGTNDSGLIDQLHKLFLVSIVLLLIPRNNQLDQLFKTAAASLPLIFNLLGCWFVLFLAFAIAFTQVFGLTRFGTNENGNINFRTVPKALILLFRTSIGEGWNSLMVDFASIVPPRCTAVSSFFDSDCGSSAWARGLFVSWNIISMYIFVSLFVSLIFESFSYVYQRSSGLTVISRDEIRRFKQAWSEFDKDGSGYISKYDFPRLLGELSGVFQMRIYEGDFTVRNIIEDCSVQPGEVSSVGRTIESGIDLAKLAERVSHIPVDEIRRRRERMNVFYHEMMLSADPERGINFTNCLMILAHYNVITDSKSLRLEEFLRRRARLQRVQESIRRDTVIGFFDTVYYSQKFRRALRLRREARMMASPQTDIPSIFVELPDESSGSSGGATPHDFTSSAPVPPSRPARPSIQIDTSLPQSDSASSLDVLRPGSTPVKSSGLLGLTPSLSPTRARLGSTDTAYHGPSRSPPRSPTLGGRHSRQNSAVSAGLGAQGVIEDFDSSAWGESLRRSFTTKRHSES